MTSHGQLHAKGDHELRMEKRAPPIRFGCAFFALLGLEAQATLRLPALRIPTRSLPIVLLLLIDQEQDQEQDQEVRSKWRQR